MIIIKTTEMEELKKEDVIVDDESYITQSIEPNKHLQNVLYGVWEDDYEEETLLSY